jgi:hypothetical protein
MKNIKELSLADLFALNKYFDDVFYTGSFANTHQAVKEEIDLRLEYIKDCLEK